MEVKVKVCGMREAANVADVARLSPDYLGFIFYPKSPRDVSKQPDLRSVLKSLPTDVEPVAVVVNMALHEMIDLTELGFETLQLHGQESPEICQALRDHEFTVIKVFSVNEDFDFTQLEAYVSSVDYFLFDTKGKQPGGNGVRFDWGILQQYNLNKPFFLSGGIGPDHLADLKAFDHPMCYAIDVNSGFETTPGNKNVTLLEQTILKQKSQLG